MSRAFMISALLILVGCTSGQLDPLPLTVTERPACSSLTLLHHGAVMPVSALHFSHGGFKIRSEHHWFP